MTIGVYEIYNTANEKRYIGSSVNIENRMKQHKRNLIKGRHINPHLQSAWNTYSADAFEFRMLISTYNPKALTFIEQGWIDASCCSDPEFGYNMCPVAGSRFGSKHSPETIEKITKNHVGHTGRTRSPETRAKISASNMGNTNCLGYKHSPETRAKMAISKKQYWNEKRKREGAEL